MYLCPVLFWGSVPLYQASKVTDYTYEWSNVTCHLMIQHEIGVRFQSLCLACFAFICFLLEFLIEENLCDGQTHWNKIHISLLYL